MPRLRFDCLGYRKGILGEQKANVKNFRWTLSLMHMSAIPVLDD